MAFYQTTADCGVVAIFFLIFFISSSHLRYCKQKTFKMRTSGPEVASKFKCTPMKI